MSEYQYYEFRAIDRTLSSSAQEAMRQLSSRVRLTPTQASFVYNFGDFRGDPVEVLAQYFDIMLYMANWGSRQLIFRLPQSVVHPDDLRPYEIADHISVSQHASDLILNIEFHEEDSGYWLEGEGVLDGLVTLRQDILQGDFRPLYLVWLKAAEYETGQFMDGPADEEDEDEENNFFSDPRSIIEPPIPPGLQKLTKPLENLLEFFWIDSDLVDAATENSPTASTPAENLESRIADLTEAERDAFLLGILRRQPDNEFRLIKRLRELAAKDAVSSAAPVELPKRTFAEIVTRGKERARRREAEEKRIAQQQHRAQMEALMPQAAQLWQRVYALIAEKKTRAYEDAILILKQLQQLAEYEGKKAEFNEEITQIRRTYRNLSGLTSRLTDAKL